MLAEHAAGEPLDDAAGRSRTARRDRGRDRRGQAGLRRGVSCTATSSPSCPIPAATPGSSLGASPRAGISLLRVAKAHAVVEGRDYVIPADVKEVAEDVLSHRVILAARGAHRGHRRRRLDPRGARAHGHPGMTDPRPPPARSSPPGSTWSRGGSGRRSCSRSRSGSRSRRWLALGWVQAARPADAAAPPHRPPRAGRGPERRRRPRGAARHGGPLPGAGGDARPARQHARVATELGAARAGAARPLRDRVGAARPLPPGRRRAHHRRPVRACRGADPAGPHRPDARLPARVRARGAVHRRRHARRRRAGARCCTAPRATTCTASASTSRARACAACTGARPRAAGS